MPVCVEKSLPDPEERLHKRHGDAAAVSPPLDNIFEHTVSPKQVQVKPRVSEFLCMFIFVTLNSSGLTTFKSLNGI